MTNPVQSLRVRLHGSALARKIHIALVVLHVVVPLAAIEVMLLAQGMTITDSLVLLVPLSCLGIVAVGIFVRGFRRRPGTAK